MRRRVRWTVGATVVVVAAAVAAALVVSGRGDRRATAQTPRPRPTVVVTRGPLHQTTTLTGTVGYPNPTAVNGPADGIVTWLPSVGATVEPGHALYRVDDAPVFLFRGPIPLYRTLAVPPSPPRCVPRKAVHCPTRKVPSLPIGRDVDLVAGNLAALGFWSGPIRQVKYAADLADAVRDWQRAEHIPVTGSVAPGSVVVATGAVRVAAVDATVGGPANIQVMSVSTTGRTVTLKVPTMLAGSLAPGQRITVRLADATSIGARVSTIGSIASSSDGTPTVAVTAAPTSAASIAHTVLGPVTASLVTAARRDVLSVPVTAPLALADGGFALERADGSLLRVALGLATEGRVEVSGAGLVTGLRVVVAS